MVLCRLVGQAKSPLSEHYRKYYAQHQDLSLVGRRAGSRVKRVKHSLYASRIRRPKKNLLLIFFY